MYEDGIVGTCFVAFGIDRCSTKYMSDLLFGVSPAQYVSPDFRAGSNIDNALHLTQGDDYFPQEDIMSQASTPIQRDLQQSSIQVPLMYVCGSTDNA